MNNFPVLNLVLSLVILLQGSSDLASLTQLQLLGCQSDEGCTPMALDSCTLSHDITNTTGELPTVYSS